MARGGDSCALGLSDGAWLRPELLRKTAEGLRVNHSFVEHQSHRHTTQFCYHERCAVGMFSYVLMSVVLSDCPALFS